MTRELVDLVDLDHGDPRWALALPVLQELRPHLTEALLETVMREGGPQGLRFLAAFDGETCLGVAGWRFMATTSVIRKLYVDDLVTARERRSAGVGAVLLHELEHRARAAGCSALELDSGVQRHGAHRFYLRERMRISSHHFAKEL
ncbi:GNAT family N-acetyltransferase [Georgenia deserti]|uniref:GNAT family N-acetyltransferase n=1 Tax=Georgenia deserti TaxID=2093781 RepID=A0ABW4L731_9MICO